MTNVSVRKTQAGQKLIEPMIMGDGKFAFYDGGFYNVAVTPTAEDVGRGGRGPDNKPLASSRQFLFADQDINGPINFPIIGAPIMNLKVGACVETDPSTGACLKQQLIAVDEGTGQETVVCIDLNMDGKCGVEDDILLQRVAVDGAFKAPGIRNRSCKALTSTTAASRPWWKWRSSMTGAAISVGSTSRTWTLTSNLSDCRRRKKRVWLPS
jgi:hypothetical protein